LVDAKSFFDSSAASELSFELTLGVVPSTLLISADTVSFFDVTEINFVKNAINAVISEAERIDVVVNNAGYPLIGALELIRQRSFMSRQDEKDLAEIALP
jgi:NAD(P)-dependent dehydrogenase (short-subunit alcohol dehydrogenase family)